MTFTDRLKNAVRNENTAEVRSMLENEKAAYANDVTPLVQAAYLASRQSDKPALFASEQAKQMGVDIPVPSQDIGELLLGELLRPLNLTSQQQEEIFYAVTQHLKELLDKIDQGDENKDPISVANYLELVSMQDALSFAGFLSTTNWSSDPADSNYRANPGP